MIEKIKRLSVKNFFFLTLAGVINAVGVTLFIAPVKLYDSGISGTAILLSQITPQWLSLSLFLLVLNIPLFLYGCKKQGGAFTLYAIYAVTVYSVCAWLITDVLPIDVSVASPLAGSDLLLCALFGGLISGVGSGISIRFGGAMDGIEVLAVIMSKKLSISISTLVMVYNVVLYVICGFVINSWTLPLYSIVTYCAALKAVDYIVDGFDRSKAATIVTTNPQSVGKVISDTFGCGLTMTRGKGFYSNAEKTVLYVVLNRFQIGKMKEIVRGADPKAYISIAEVADVFHPDDD